MTIFYQDKGVFLLLKELVNGLSTVIAKLPDLEKMFPTEQSRYKAFIRFLYFALFVEIVSTILKAMSRQPSYIINQAYGQGYQEHSLLMLFTSLFVIISIIGITYVMLYIYVKSGFLEFVLKLFLGLLVSSIITCILFAILGSIAPIIGIIAAIIANRRRLALLKKYKSYVWYSAGYVLIPIICIILALGSFFLSHLLRNSIIPTIISPLFIILAVLAPVLITHYALKTEMAKGSSFLQVMKLLQVIPVMLVFCFFSYMTLLHINAFSDESILGHLDGDPLSTGNDVGIAHASPVINGTSIDHSDPFSSNSDDFSGRPTAPPHPLNVDPLIPDSSIMNSDTTVVSQPTINVPHPIDAQPNAVAPDLSAQPNAATLYNNNGFAHETIKQTSPDHFVIENNMSQSTGTANVNSVTGTITIHTQADTVSMSSDGAIHDASGLQMGRIAEQPNGDKIVMDSEDQTVEIIKSDGSILNPQHQSVGKIK